jgi:Transcriptional regulator PadR-like family
MASVSASSEDALRAEEGSLYPALYRIERQGWITAERGVSKNNLRARFYKLTKLYQKRSSIEVFHKSLKQNASLEKSPTRTPTTQRNHFFASLCAYIKLERLRLGIGLNHFALKSKIYLSALQSAFAELVKIKAQPQTA